MWLTLAFFSSLFLGLDEVAKKSALKDNAVIPVLALSILLSAALFLPLQLVSVFSPDTLLDTAFYIPHVSADAHWGILLKAAIVLGSWIFGFFATKHLPLTISSSVKALQHNGADGTLCRFDVKSGSCHLVTEIVYILYQLVMQRIAFFQYLEYFQACTDNARSQ